MARKVPPSRLASSAAGLDAGAGDEAPSRLRPAPAGAPPPAVEPRWVTPAGVAILVLARTLLLPHLGAFNDEAYYWEWSRRLAGGYFDHPPAVAWILAASTRLFGDTQLALHLPAFVLSLVTSYALFRLCLDLFPGRRDLAWASVLALNATPLFGMGAIWTTPDAPLLASWTVSALLVWRAMHGRPRLWYAAGLTGGLGLLSKYHFVLFPASVLAFLLVRERRAWLRRREPWIAALLMLLVFLPDLVWNARHGWPSIRYQIVDRHGDAIRPWLTIPRYFAAQQALSPLLWLAAVAGLVRSVRRARAGSEPHAYLAVLSSVTLVFFGLVALVTFVNANWLGVGYVALIVSAADALVSARSRLVRLAPAALGTALCLLVYLQAITNVVPIPPNADLAADVAGWPEVGARLEALVAASPDPRRTFVFSRRLQHSALAAFYTHGALDVTRIGGRRDAYDDWIPAGGRRGEDAVYFCDDKWYEPPDASLFSECTAAGVLPVVRWGRTVRTYSFWTCRGYAGAPEASAGRP